MVKRKSVSEMGGYSFISNSALLIFRIPALSALVEQGRVVHFDCANLNLWMCYGWHVYRLLKLARVEHSYCLLHKDFEDRKSHPYVLIREVTKEVSCHPVSLISKLYCVHVINRI